MSQDPQIRFRTATRGYNKEDVNNYISKISINFQSVEQSLKSAINQLHQELESQKELLAAQRDTLLQQAQLLTQMDTLQAANKRNEAALAEAKRIIDRKNEELTAMRHDTEALRTCCSQVCKQIETLQMQVKQSAAEQPTSPKTGVAQTPCNTSPCATTTFAANAMQNAEPKENVFDTLMQQLGGSVDELCRRAAAYDATPTVAQPTPDAEEPKPASKQTIGSTKDGITNTNPTAPMAETFALMTQAMHALRAQCEKMGKSMQNTSSVPSPESQNQNE